MKALIIGAAGFVGGYLINELRSAGWEVCATCLANEKIDEECSVRVLDIMDRAATEQLIAQEAPDVIYHLAAQSSVSVSWKRPQLTAEINVVGSINVLEAKAHSHRLGRGVRIYPRGSLSALRGRTAPSRKHLRRNKGLSGNAWRDLCARVQNGYYNGKSV